MQSYFHFSIERTELQGYQDIVFIDPSLRDTLFMMHKASNRDAPCLARYTSMTRRRHLETNLTRDRTERYIKHQHNVEDIRLRLDNLSHTNSHSISSADFDNYCSVRGEAKQILGPMYEQPIFRKMRWRTSIGKQRDMTFLNHLLLLTIRLILLLVRLQNTRSSGPVKQHLHLTYLLRGCQRRK